MSRNCHKYKVDVSPPESNSSRFLDTLLKPPIDSKTGAFTSTTILAVRHGGRAVMAGDGQVTFGQTVVKQTARKIRRLYNDKILAGFAGSAADSFALFARFEGEARTVPRQSRTLRGGARQGLAQRPHFAPARSDAGGMDANATFLLSGNGDLIEPDDGIVAIGSGGPFALAAAKALDRQYDS